MPLFTDVNMKVCTVCKQLKSLGAFYNRKASEDGKAYRCKVCDNLAVGEFRKLHEDRHRAAQRARNRKHKYGLSELDYQLLIEKQNNKCAICFVELQQNATTKHTPETLCIDHCHETGVVRGLLCAKCNKGLGLFNDDPVLLLTAIDYIANAEIH